MQFYILIATSTCGASSNENNTYFSQPSTLPLSCSLEICPCNSNIKQIRLDFETFTLDGPDTTAALPVPAVAADGAGGDTFTYTDGTQAWTSHPNTHGQCNSDYFTIGSSGTSPPVICGENAGQHMYVETDGVNCVTMTFNMASPIAQQWSVKVAQIEEGMIWEAPKGCLQYFTGTSGSFSSFNLANNVHLANQDYNICMRREAGYCSISYLATTFQVSAVDFKNNFGSGTGKCNSINLFPGDPAAPSEQLQLGNDWIAILEGEDTVGVDTYDRFCGQQLHANDQDAVPTSVTSSSIPFRVGVFFDDSEAAGTKAELGADDTSAIGDADRGDVGFDIGYTQNLCA
ncbi:uncharacterized protein LOC111702179 isoform X2 [Eurytemora carolleeae]|uniref:uncharacterized protein LOC111702179 isoform X2 n=1 Tax=Eurytemora carolleeae TaxID=1294199 RepID=UPI000C781532|nr:uncharacterized protein LOC111702179 isoform X2 [Eurytemora carolleeae]|eukprot:XP_023329555.1 uncharacterized protein LOC111702179 isoform X2 [Eurytemora affinis]